MVLLGMTDENPELLDFLCWCPDRDDVPTHFVSTVGPESAAREYVTTVARMDELKALAWEPAELVLDVAVTRRDGLAAPSTWRIAIKLTSARKPSR